MTTARTRRLATTKARMPRFALLAGAMLFMLSGCSCERPGRHPKMGPDVPAVRVKLGDDVKGLAVAVAGPWRLVGPAGEVAAGKPLAWTPVAVSNGQVVFGTQPPVAGPLELAGTDGNPIAMKPAVAAKGGGRQYRGTLRLSVTPEGALRAVNVLPMETYLAGVLANELLRSWHVEAYKAQAVAARTYALMARNRRTRADFDLYDSTRSQVYGGFGTETDTVWKAVEATWGVVAAYRGTNGKHVLLQTFYHSTCGGDTVPAGSVFGGSTAPPLVGGTKCTYCRRSTRFRWKPVTLTKKEIGEALKRNGSSALTGLGEVARVEVAERSGANGRASRIRVVDADGKAVLVRAGTWRILIGARKVPSTWFDIEDRGDAIVLTNGRGNGHGVGLCQWGAEFLARHGKTGEEILRYYYPGVELVRAY